MGLGSHPDHELALDLPQLLQNPVRLALAAADASTWARTSLILITVSITSDTRSWMSTMSSNWALRSASLALTLGSFRISKGCS